MRGTTSKNRRIRRKAVQRWLLDELRAIGCVGHRMPRYKRWWLPGWQENQ
jgi:hypothetical protein